MPVEITLLDEIEEDSVTYVVIVAQHDGRMVFCRHRDRDTWEVPAGHREMGESAYEAAGRELREETGALEYSLTQLCPYSVSGGTRAGERGGRGGERSDDVGGVNARRGGEERDEASGGSERRDAGSKDNERGGERENGPKAGEDKTFGVLFSACIQRFGTLKNEIAQIALFDDIPDNLTYPEVQPQLIKQALSVGKPCSQEDSTP